ncbi:MAG: hypothetical protein ACE5I8_04780 [Thermodesulfobacteriota bacterium]
MIKKEIVYFERSGVENTEDVIEIVYQRLQEGDVRSVVVASSRGATGLKFARRMAKDTNLVIVSSHPGRSKPGVWDFDSDILTELEMMGCKVIKQTHVLSGLERSFSRKFSGVSHSELLAECLRTLFGTGMKVAIECAVMAADGGAIPIEKTISVGGTSAQGRGADCAIVSIPAHASNFFDFRVLEILAKPFTRD